MTRKAWPKANACRSLPMPDQCGRLANRFAHQQLAETAVNQDHQKRPERNRLGVDAERLRPESPGDGHAEQERNRPDKSDRDPLRAKQAFQHATRPRFDYRHLQSPQGAADGWQENIKRKAMRCLNARDASRTRIHPVQGLPQRNRPEFTDRPPQLPCIPLQPFHIVGPHEGRIHPHLDLVAGNLRHHRQHILQRMRLAGAHVEHLAGRRLVEQSSISPATMRTSEKSRSTSMLPNSMTRSPRWK